MSNQAIMEAAAADLGPVICVVGARPNFMKMAPILRAMAAHIPPVPVLLVHTGQHYDKDMNDRLFEDLRLPRPDVNLEVGSGTHAIQTAEVMRRFEPVVDAHKPSCVAVVGDVNSTLACALVAVKKGVPVVHIEAGLRSYDRAMPEEINRILTDQISARLYTTERTAEDNLVREGISSERVCFAGNVMIDSVVFGRANARSAAQTLRACGVDPLVLSHPMGYGVVTLHRPSNVDKPETLRALLGVLAEVAASLPLVFALHPRTRSNIDRFGLEGLVNPARMVLLPPQGYLEMLGLMAGAAMVLTDSGGLQEETTALGVPCLTLRENTERPITVEQGTNLLVGRNRAAILGAVQEILAGRGKRGRLPEFWDGRAAERIAADLYQWLMSTQSGIALKSLAT
ncbi:UDP-N-acetylglucosamine 2-epimerase (non-hydrolyzing) [Polaromonas sp. C04]|uniref:non-hydrolyzing UDP-N-acetylglucosamine 2-epimerase n=1 Tax=Polaromonas sp. C04 TaxID=1945857 RepID=UPI0009856512|nr:UDP-N-acetylglucosamine 2-epimerase (non-hydrolyzing) [Polaromonas sp. C04]OOG54277.1 UDP-N-acetylglucosamine 2-epimerase (non-hydrolyzing) [Polaromonas sp. C04]